MISNDNYFHSNLRVISPLKLFAAISAFTIFLLFIGPFNYHAFKLQTYIYFLVLIGLTYMPLLVFGFKSKIIEIVVSKKRLLGLLFILTTIGILGLLINFYEKFFIRSDSLVLFSFIDNRVSSVTGGNAIISFVGQLFGSLLIFLPMFLMLLKNKLKKRYLYIYWLIFFMFCIFDLVVFGSRNRFILSLIFLAISYFSINSATTFTLYSIKRIFPGALIFLILLVTISGFIYYLRSVIGMGNDFVFLLEHSKYAHFVQPSDNLIRYFENSTSDVLDIIIASIVNLIGYYLHGIFEMLYIIESFQEPRTFGFHTFYLPLKLYASIAGGTDPISFTTENIERTGVFTTIYGPFYYDYGYFGTLFFCLFFSVIIALLYRLASKGIYSFHVLYNFILSCLVLLFSLNIITSGNGQYVIISWFLFFAIYLFILPIRKLKLN